MTVIQYFKQSWDLPLAGCCWAEVFVNCRDSSPNCRLKKILKTVVWKIVIIGPLTRFSVQRSTLGHYLLSTINVLAFSRKRRIDRMETFLESKITSTLEYLLQPFVCSTNGIRFQDIGQVGHNSRKRRLNRYFLLSWKLWNFRRSVPVFGALDLFQAWTMHLVCLTKVIVLWCWLYFDL